MRITPLSAPRMRESVKLGGGGRRSDDDHDVEGGGECGLTVAMVVTSAKGKSWCNWCKPLCFRFGSRCPQLGAPNLNRGGVRACPCASGSVVAGPQSHVLSQTADALQPAKAVVIGAGQHRAGQGSEIQFGTGQREVATVAFTGRRWRAVVA